MIVKLYGQIQVDGKLYYIKLSHIFTIKGYKIICMIERFPSNALGIFLLYEIMSTYNETQTL